MIAEITIPGELPSLNEIIEAAKSHWGGYNAMKRAFTELVRVSCLRCPRFTKPVTVKIVWITRNCKKDPDNVMVGQKFVFDGLVAAKVLPDDSRRWVKSIEHEFRVNRNNPRVEIEIEEVEQ